jgi:hypothetical protein
MPAPVLGSVGAELLGETEPLAYDDANNSYIFAHVCEAIGRMWQPIADIVNDDEENGYPGWSALVDIDRAPAYAFPWLAMVAGVRLTLGADEDAQREEIRRADGQKRGRPSAVLRAAKRGLTGSQAVFIFERDGGSAYQVRLATLTSETPNPTQTAADIRAAIPMGNVVTYEVVDVAADTYDTLWLTHRDYDEVESVFADYNEVEADPAKQS